MRYHILIENEIRRLVMAPLPYGWGFGNKVFWSDELDNIDKIKLLYELRRMNDFKPVKVVIWDSSVKIDDDGDYRKHPGYVGETVIDNCRFFHWHPGYEIDRIIKEHEE